MNWITARKSAALLIALLMVRNGTASNDSIGPNGINSRDLGLTGEGVGIGQVEFERPGKPSFDNGSNSNFGTTPTAVFIENGIIDPTANSEVEIYFQDPNDPNAPPIPHATWVAGVMIGNDPIAPGVAGDADLYASLGNDDLMAPGNPNWSLDEKLAMAAQHVATRASGNVYAINMSFLIELESGQIADGNSLLTQFVDWSAGAGAHDVLYVTAWREPANSPAAFIAFPPADNFNGMTVAASAKVDGVYRQVAALNLYNLGVSGGRAGVDILAPGVDVELADVGGPITPLIASGTSFAAPHVTGTVALLQEHAATQMAGNANARRHEIMKAVLLNSADKIQGILGMERTVLLQHEEGSAG